MERIYSTNEWSTTSAKPSTNYVMSSFTNHVEATKKPRTSARDSIHLAGRNAVTCFGLLWCLSVAGTYSAQMTTSMLVFLLWTSGWLVACEYALDMMKMLLAKTRLAARGQDQPTTFQRMSADIPRVIVNSSMMPTGVTSISNGATSGMLESQENEDACSSKIHRQAMTLAQGKLFWALHRDRIVLNGLRIFGLCLVRSVGLQQFSVLFVFLLEHVDLLLWQPTRQVADNTKGFALLFVGYLIVAGIDASEYGRLLTSLVLIGVVWLMAQFDRSTRPDHHLQSHSQLFRLLSLGVATALSLVVALMGSIWAMYDGIYDSNSHPQPVYLQEKLIKTPANGLNWWILLAGAALCQHYLSQSSSRNKCSPSGSLQLLVGLALCLGTSLLQSSWPQGVLDTLACLYIFYCFAEYGASRSKPSPKKEAHDVNDHDVYQEFLHLQSSDASSPVGSITTNDAGVFGKIRSMTLLLWRRPDSRKILLFLTVNISYMFVELAVGIWTNSLGLIGDAGHMLFDNAALVIGLVASYISQLPADDKFTYGYGRVEVLSGLLNSLLLMVMALNLIVEAIHRFFDPPEVKTDHLLLTSVIGLVVNLVGLVWFHDHAHHGHSHGHSHDHSQEHGHTHSHSHSHDSLESRSHGHSHHHEQGHHHIHGHGHSHDGACGHNHEHEDRHVNANAVHNSNSFGNNLQDQAASSSATAATCKSSNTNMYGVYLHVLADTLGSVGVIVSSLLIEFKQWHAADPVSSAMISILILFSTLPLLKDTVLQLLQRVPDDMEQQVTQALQQIRQELPQVLDIVQWHCWRHSNEHCVASLQLLVTAEAEEQTILQQAREIFKSLTTMDRFVTIQIEKAKSNRYRDGTSNTDTRCVC